MVAVVATGPYGCLVPDLVRALLVLRNLLVGASARSRASLHESAATDTGSAEWTGLLAQSTPICHLASSLEYRVRYETGRPLEDRPQPGFEGHGGLQPFSASGEQPERVANRCPEGPDFGDLIPDSSLDIAPHLGPFAAE